jgi:hypothetical protein
MHHMVILNEAAGGAEESSSASSTKDSSLALGMTEIALGRHETHDLQHSAFSQKLLFGNAQPAVSQSAFRFCCF